MPQLLAHLPPGAAARIVLAATSRATPPGDVAATGGRSSASGTQRRRPGAVERARRTGGRRRQAVEDATARAAEEVRDFFEGTLGGGEADALEGALDERFEALQRQREVGAALGGHQRVDLVDDGGVDRAQNLAGVRRQEEVERLRRGDEDVRRGAREAGALAGRACRRCGCRRRGPRGVRRAARRRQRCRRWGRGDCARCRRRGP